MLSRGFGSRQALGRAVQAAGDGNTEAKDQTDGRIVYRAECRRLLGGTLFPTAEAEDGPMSATGA